MKSAMIILIGPSAVGKSSFLDKILKENTNLCDIITYTSRAMRPGESEGAPYHFVSKERFEELQKKDFFVEWAVVHGNFYGTPKDQIEEAWKLKKTVIMDIDVQGASTLKKTYPQAATIFLLPPSEDSLRQRLIKRGTVKDLEVRMENARREIALANQFDHRIVNDNFDKAFEEFRKIVEKTSQNQ